MCRWCVFRRQTHVEVRPYPSGWCVCVWSGSYALRWFSRQTIAHTSYPPYVTCLYRPPSRHIPPPRHILIAHSPRLFIPLIALDGMRQDRRGTVQDNWGTESCPRKYRLILIIRTGDWLFSAVLSIYISLEFITGTKRTEI